MSFPRISCGMKTSGRLSSRLWPLLKVAFLPSVIYLWLTYAHYQIHLIPSLPHLCCTRSLHRLTLPSGQRPSHPLTSQRNSSLTCCAPLLAPKTPPGRSNPRPSAQNMHRTPLGNSSYPPMGHPQQQPRHLKMTTTTTTTSHRSL